MGSSPVEFEGSITTPFAGTLRNLYVKSNGNLANDTDFNVCINGSPSGIVATITGGSAVGSDLVSTAAVSPGDDVAVQVIGDPEGIPIRASIQLEF